MPAFVIAANTQRDHCVRGASPGNDLIQNFLEKHHVQNPKEFKYD